MMKLKTNLGFTAVEVVIGIGLVSILTLAIISTQVVVSKEQIALTQKLDESIDTTQAERIIFRDLNGIDPSYNNVRLPDGTNPSLGFFDQYPDIPATVLKQTISREVVLKAGNKNEFYALVQDSTAGPLMVYDPVAAYAVGAAPSDFNVSATLQFVSVNHQNWVTNQREQFWVNGRVLMLDTPAKVRPLEGNGTLDMSRVPRSPVFVGVVEGSQLNRRAELINYVNYTHPELKTQIESADAFLRTAPSMGGGPPLIRLRAVRLIRYYLETYEDLRYATPPARLFRSSYEGGTWSQPLMLVDGVEEVIFKRDNVLKKMIHFKINKLPRINISQGGG